MLGPDVSKPKIFMTEFKQGILQVLHIPQFTCNIYEVFAKLKSKKTKNCGGPRGRVVSTLNQSSSHRCGFEPSLGHMWDKPSCACGSSGVFSRGSPGLCPTLRLTWLSMSEIILMGRKTQIKKIYCSVRLFLIPDCHLHWSLLSFHTESLTSYSVQVSASLQNLEHHNTL